MQHPLTETLKTQGRSARWLAAQVGTSPAMLSRIVNGERSPSATFKRLVSKTLGVPESLLFPTTAAPADQGDDIVAETV